LYEVGGYINSSLDLGEVLELVIDSLIRVTGAERGFIMLADPVSGDLRVEVARNMDSGALDTPTSEVSRNVVQAVMQRGTPLLLSDALTDPSYQRFQTLVAPRPRSILC